eukprot:GEMP01053075.1.p1 GENE.GEMP01053075.1~~GEMP01053075.1.p1  ORF type:complete len:137 (+),score=28.08 GEMP01053075.1:116-526(+)
MVLHLVNCACAQVLKVVLFIVPLDLPKAELLADFLYGNNDGELICRISFTVEEPEEPMKDARDATDAVQKTATYRGTRHHTTRQRSSYGGNPFLRAQDYVKPSRRVLRKRTWASRPSYPKGAVRALARRKSFSVLQ